MVEVKAQIIGGSVLLAGDTIQVCITLTAPLLDPATSVQSSEVCEVIAWGSAQVHCICMINDALVTLPTERKNSEVDVVTNSNTSFAPWKGERGHVVLSTKPKILFCDLQLIPGESRSFVYRENLPVDAPPTYRGKLVKYAYKVTVGTQKLGSPINLLRLPIRVIVLQGAVPALVNSDTEDLAPRTTSRHMTLQMIQGLSTQKNISQYNIGHDKGHVVTFTVYKNSYKLGEDITATFDFSKAQVQCVQRKENQRPVVVPYTKTHEVCLSFSHTNFLLTIPLSVTPTFSTDIVKLRWSIHFEFVLNIGGEAQSLPGWKSNKTEDMSNLNQRTKDKTWQAPPKLRIETLVWDLPITVCPASPSQLSQALGVPSV
ncbi:RAB6A-GEF complex partner protein 2 [Armadillidium nasatum]|uniref:RAB6A-GEF complex partner protein 2 n=1 Tax=Armadillidium nasatum TaxID=96803 RepID=A0A5N5SSW0_9CRUS|nr:RAB6A-GEF complex partner protein 2 [Armadillidium nasatum]